MCFEALLQPAFLKYKAETSQVTWYEYRNLIYPKDRLAMLIFIPALGELGVKDAVKTLEENLLSRDYDIASASADALKEITKKDYHDKITAQEFRTDFDWNYIDNLQQKKFVLIRTNLGEIKIELFPNEAPFTVQNFLKLAEKKYYDGIIFHRVVPNFVIQAGDPTGTGFGGPDYSIRTEISQLKFETGILGMASAGKDTEGSQFFITHSPQPHLDGKYTVFGRVIDGMDIVDRIQVGDYIESVIISSP
jgi:peptidylprolyl isomerase